MNSLSFRSFCSWNLLSLLTNFISAFLPQVIKDEKMASFLPQDEAVLDALHRMLPCSETVTNLHVLWHQVLIRPLLEEYYQEIDHSDGYPLAFRLCYP